MTVLLVLLATCFLLYAWHHWLSIYSDVVCSGYRYRYYALRDRMGMLVMRGELDEDSWEYRHIVDTINFHIKALEQLSMLRLVLFLMGYHTNSRVRGEVRSLRKSVDPIVAEILVEYLTTTVEILRRNSRAQTIAVTAILPFLSVRLRIVDRMSKHGNRLGKLKRWIRGVDPRRVIDDLTAEGATLREGLPQSVHPI